jgi:polyhydroxyalkanoate synthesis repressor PhaR
MEAKRIIKKYPNRRLYDTAISKYVTLNDVRSLILEGLEIQVVDAVTEEDITRQILMQIINEQESGKQPLFSTELLARLIRMYGGVVPGVFSRFMEQSLEVFMQHQADYQKRMQRMFGDEAVRTFSRMAEENLQAWQEVQKNFFRMAGPRPTQRNDKRDNQD